MLTIDSTPWGEVEIIEIKGSHIDVALLFSAMTLAETTDIWPVEVECELDYESIMVICWRNTAQTTIEFLRFLCDTEDIALENYTPYAVQQMLPLWDVPEEEEEVMTYYDAFVAAFLPG